MPSNFSDVNFLPEEVVSNRKHQSQVKSLNKIAVSLMAVTLVIGAGIFGYNYYTQSRIKSVRDEISVKETEIRELNEFAITGYKLGLRLDAINTILNQRVYFKKVLDQVYAEIPDGVSIVSMQVNDEGSVTISGKSYPNYIPIAVFQDNLVNSESEYFSNIRLRSASLDKTSGEISFTINFLVDLEKTYEPLR